MSGYIRALHLPMIFFKRRILAAVIMLLAIVSIVVGLSVDDSITEDDVRYQQIIVQEFKIGKYGGDTTFSNQIERIRAIQNAIQAIAPLYRGIPIKQLRSIKQVYLAGYGACYDKSYVIEKMLRIDGFKVRHVSLYFDKQNDGFLKTFFRLGSPSHAVSEVLTTNGWVLVDPLVPYVGVTQNSKAVGIEEVRNRINEKSLTQVMPIEMQGNYSNPFYFLYGMYSRNGYLYPPYLPVPDYHIRQFMYNFL